MSILKAPAEKLINECNGLPDGNHTVKSVTTRKKTSTITALIGDSVVTLRGDHHNGKTHELVGINNTEDVIAFLSEFMQLHKSR